MNPVTINEDMVEEAAKEVLAELDWEVIDCYEEVFGEGGTIGRDDQSEVILIPRLKEALKKLNASITSEEINSAIEEIVKDRSALNPAVASKEIYKLIRDGVLVNAADKNGEEASKRIRIIDWDEPNNNDFLLTSQLWITSDMYKRRADLVGFVNGIPLLFIELKASHNRIENAYKNNLRDYKKAIPQIFNYNGFVILSNGSKSKIGTSTSEWEHFSEWKKINSEGEEGVVSLETMIRGTCQKERLLDLIENFLLYKEDKGGIKKLIAKNHQYIGVNNAIESVKNKDKNKGRLGVFWHTQGSGKSYSMIFFSQKVLRKLPGNYSFIIVTDRIDLDGQIYKNFVDVGAVTKKEAQASSGSKLKQLLTEDHRYVFTLIQKFGTDPGEAYPMLSERSDVIVMTDEAHRSQYDVLAMNMRDALPNAAFIGFTGTPLIAGEEKTKEVFGDYISIYNFKQSTEDGATVPLYYEKRIPELQLTNKDLNEDLQRLIDEASLDKEQEKKLEREFGREYHLITRDDRLDKIAEDIVSHFMERGHMGKAMIVSIDKITAVKMYERVKKYWDEYLEGLKNDLGKASDREKEHISAKIRYMEETDMAVVVSQSQNEIDDMAEKGFDIIPHRKRIVNEDLETKFKDSDDPFRIVFVCAMWMTGFDVPSCSTIYLDKPMKNHTLMQAIARANRVFEGKVSGLIVDYVGVFRNLQKALAIYGSGSGGGIEGGDTPVKNKDELVEELRIAIEETKEFCKSLGIDFEEIKDADGFKKIALIDDAVEAIFKNEESKLKFLHLSGFVLRIYKAILPDQKAKEFLAVRDIIYVIVKKIRDQLPPPDISEISQSIEELLDQSIEAEGYIITAPLESESTAHRIDLSQIDFEALREKFEEGRKRSEAQKLESMIRTKLSAMVERNRTRVHLYEKLKELIDQYNQGALNIEHFFEELLEFAKKLNEEDKRALTENISEEELAVFDLLTKPTIELTDKERAEVKKVAKELLETLKQEKLVLDWRKKQQSRAAVKLEIEKELDRLPEKFDKNLYDKKCDKVYRHVYDSYYGEDRSVYSVAG